MKKPFYYITVENRKTEKWVDFKFTNFDDLVNKIDLNKYEVVMISARNFTDRAKEMAERNIKAYHEHLDALYEQGFFEYNNIK